MFFKKIVYEPELLIIRLKEQQDIINQIQKARNVEQKIWYKLIKKLHKEGTQEEKKLIEKTVGIYDCKTILNINIKDKK